MQDGFSSLSKPAKQLMQFVILEEATDVSFSSLKQLVVRASRWFADWLSVAQGCPDRQKQAQQPLPANALKNDFYLLARSLCKGTKSRHMQQEATLPNCSSVALGLQMHMLSKGHI